MNTQQLKNVLAMDKYCKNIIFDVCALDQLSDKKPKCNISTAIIVNLDPANLPGSHWVCLYLRKHHYAEFFCSYGTMPPQACLELLQLCHCQIKINTVTFQEDTFVCGQYCLFYILSRSRGIPMHKILHNLDVPYNDPLMHNFVKRIYPKVPFNLHSVV